MFVLDRCVAEPQLLALMALRTLGVMVLVFVISHEVVFQGPNWVNRQAAAQQMAKTKPSVIARCADCSHTTVAMCPLTTVSLSLVADS